jgi:hypothetical protein
MVIGGGVTRVFLDTATGTPTSFQSLEITGGTVTAPTTGGGGAAIDDSGGGGLILTSVTITGNAVTTSGTSTRDVGGAIYEGSTSSNTGVVTATGSTFTGNTLTVSGTTSTGFDGGAGIYNVGTGLTTLTNDTFTANAISDTSGATCHNAAPPGSAGGAFDGGAAAYVSGGTSASSLAVSGSTFANNSVAVTGCEAFGGGGAIYFLGGGGTVTGSTFTSNGVSLTGGTNPDFNGGGALLDASGDGNLTISGSAFQSNSFSSQNEQFSGGGAIEDVSSSTVANAITGSTLAGNTVTITGTASYSGGGAVLSDGGATAFVNDTISGNAATVPTGTAEGGGAINFGDAPGTITFTTIAANQSSQSAGAVLNYTGRTLTFKSTIIAGNGGSQCAVSGTGSAFATAGNSIESTSPSQCGLAAASGDLVGVDPTLAPLGDYGGNHLHVHALYTGSPAIDHVPAAKCTDQSTPTPLAVSTDEIGSTRNSDGQGCDVGAFEGSIAAPTTTTTTTPTVPAPPPVNTALPVIKGTPLPPNTLTCLPGTWSIAVVPYEIAPPPLTYTFQWYRNGVPIPGATSARYTVQISDEGASLTCQVTAGDTSGHTSAQSGVAVVAMPGTTNCEKPSGKLTTSKVGPLSLGETRAAARKALKHFHAQSPSIDDFCLFGGWGIRVGYPSSKLLATFRASKKLTGRIVLALTANIHYNVNGVTQGSTVKQASKKLKLGKVHHIGKNDWYVTTNGRYVLKVRKGVIQEIGPANTAFTRSYKAQTVFLNSFSSV